MIGLTQHLSGSARKSATAVWQQFRADVLHHNAGGCRTGIRKHASWTDAAEGVWHFIEQASDSFSWKWISGISESLIP